MPYAHRLSFVFALCVVGLAGSPAAQGSDERILSYHSDIAVHKDGWLTVTEKITVRSAGRSIRRGIYRDYPTRYTLPDGSNFIAPFEVVSVRRDGRAEPYHIKSEGVGKRIYMGRKNVLLQPGVHAYELTYRVGRMISFPERNDELYYNITGNSWEFPIDRASAAVTLPGGIAAGDIALKAFTGAKGATGRNYTATVDLAGAARFQTTTPLAAKEGLTISVKFPKGFVAEPTGGEKWGNFFLDNGMVLAALVGLIVVTAYFAGVWLHVGRDPAKGVIIPLFGPPAELCPASVRYVLRMGFDKTCLAVGIVNLAVKGLLTIKESGGDYSLQKREADEPPGMSRGEKAARGELFKGAGKIEMAKENHVKFRQALKKMKLALAGEYKRKYFFANLRWFLPGLAMSIAAVLAIAMVGALIERRPEIAILCVWLTIWSIGVFFLVRQVLSAWRAVRRGKGIAGAVGLTVFAVPFCIAELIVLGILVRQTSIWLLPALVALGAINVIFHRLLKRPTAEGRKVMDQVEGFRMYLGTAERDMLDTAHPAEKTPELFEKFLPYALALGVENAWGEKFRDVLAEAARATEQGYRPSWYYGTALAAGSAASFASSFGSSFSGALSTASAAPSSSGSGGGGSSGGGGGGGGGGGW